MKKGKFSKQEKDTLKQAAQEYAQEHSLPSEDFSWLFATRTSEHKKEAAGAWQVIAQSLPHRTYKAVYACGTRMLHELNYQVSCVLLQSAVAEVGVEGTGKRGFSMAEDRDTIACPSRLLLRCVPCMCCAPALALRTVSWSGTKKDLVWILQLQGRKCPVPPVAK